MILETILQELQTIRTLLATQTGGPVVTQPALVTPPTQPQTNAPALTPPSNVTSDQIMALIQPHIANETIKAALGAAMRSIGINALPEAQPHQYGQMYALFQQVIAQHTGGAATMGGGGLGASII